MWNVETDPGTVCGQHTNIEVLPIPITRPGLRCRIVKRLAFSFKLLQSVYVTLNFYSVCAMRRKSHKSKKERCVVIV
jgi:hypothetical protein